MWAVHRACHRKRNVLKRTRLLGPSRAGKRWKMRSAPQMVENGAKENLFETKVDRVRCALFWVSGDGNCAIREPFTSHSVTFITNEINDGVHCHCNRSHVNWMRQQHSFHDSFWSYWHRAMQFNDKLNNFENPELCFLNDSPDASCLFSRSIEFDSQFSCTKSMGFLRFAVFCLFVVVFSFFSLRSEFDILFFPFCSEKKMRAISTSVRNSLNLDTVCTTHKYK